MRSLRHAVFALLCAIATTLPGPRAALAAGIEYPDNGTIAIGRGGANAANPDDGLAFQYNPAGLAQQRGMRLMMDARLSHQGLTFASSAKGASIVSNSAEPFLGPSGTVSYGIGEIGPLSELTFAIGATGPSSIGKTTFPMAGAQRYAITSTDYFIGFYSLAVAAGYQDWLRVGITGQLVQGNATFKQAVWSGTGKGPSPDINDRTFDANATVQGSSDFIPTFVAGLTVLPHKDWAIGLSYRPKIKFDAPGTLTIAPPDLMKDAVKQEGNKANLLLNFADTVRLGVQYKVLPTLRVELDGIYERWSVLPEIRVKTHDIYVNLGGQKGKVNDIVFDKSFQDTFGARVGADWQVLPERVTVRAGYLHETSAIKDDHRSVDFGNWQRDGVSVGTSLQFFGAWLDFAYAHHFLPTVTVTDSTVVQQTSPPIGAAVSESSVVGNGTYSASMDIFSMSLRVPFGDLKAAF